MMRRQFLNMDKKYALLQKDTLTYTNLRYDKYGGVPLDVYGDNIDSTRWNYVSDFVFEPSNPCYDALSEICKYLDDEDVTLMFINTPTRRSYYETQTNLNEVKKHINICDSIISSHHHIFLDELSFDDYPDSLFADCSHLNRKGSIFLTERICHHLDSLKAICDSSCL